MTVRNALATAHRWAVTGPLLILPAPAENQQEGGVENPLAGLKPNLDFLGNPATNKIDRMVTTVWGGVLVILVVGVLISLVQMAFAKGRHDHGGLASATRNLQWSGGAFIIAALASVVIAAFIALAGN